MKRTRKFTILTAVVLGAVVLSAGCAQQKRTTAKPRSTPPARMTEGKPAPEAKPAVKTMRAGWPANLTNATTAWSSMAYPTGNAETSAIGIEKGMPKEVRLNRPFDYDLVVTNLSKNELHDVVVTDQMGDNFKLGGSSPRAQTTPDGKASWNLGSLGPGESKRIRANGTATAEGEVCSCASVSYNSLLCACVPVVQPRLRLTKAGPAEVLKCDAINYQFVVSNAGTGSVPDVRIVDDLPAGLVAADGKRQITFNAGTLAPGQSKPFTAKVQAERTGRFENKATATGEGGLSVTSGTVATVVRQPVLKIEAGCDEREYIGRPVDYQIVVTNTGDGVARDTMVVDTLPAGVKFVSAGQSGRFANGKITWNLGTLEPRATRTLMAVVQPNDAGTFRHTAKAEAYCAAAVSDSCTTRVVGIPAVLLEVIDVEDPIEVGDNETYVITVTNQGSMADTNIRIVATLEANQQHVSNSGATRGTVRGAQIVFEPLASLAPKAKATWRVVVRNVKAGDVRFKIAMDTDQLTRPVEETEATNVYE